MTIIGCIGKGTKMFQGQHVTSDVWLTGIRELLGIPLGDMVPFFCDNCGHGFESAITPIVCALCHKPPGDMATELEHTSSQDVTVQMKTFPLNDTLVKEEYARRHKESLT